MNAPLSNGAEKRAAALAEVQQMQDDLHAAHALIESLRKDLDRADDRMVLLMDERTRLRKEHHIVLTALIRLSTEVEVINRQSAAASDILRTANALIARVDGREEPTVPPEPTALATVDAAVAALEKELTHDH